MTRLIPLLAIALLSTTGCKKQQASAPPTGSGSAVTTPAGSDTAPTAPTPDAADAVAGAGSGSGSAAPPKNVAIAIVQGTSCAGHGEQITKANDTRFKLAGKTLSGVHKHGCGCPTGPVHTLVYKATSPLEVRICYDPTKDSCEALCHDVSFDLATALADGKATDVKFVD